MRPRSLVPLLFACAIAGPARAHARPIQSFAADLLAWSASDVVVVRSHEPIDGTVTVVESWLGSLPPGKTLRLPGLQRFTPEQARLERGPEGPYDAAPDPPRHVVSGARMVLFLGERTGWPFELSFAFSENGRLYGGQDGGTVRIIDLHQSEAELASLVRETLAQRNAIARARATHGFAQLAALARGNVPLQRDAAIVALGGLGRAALPTLRELASDDSLESEELVDALAQAAGSSAGAEVNRLFAREVDFWRAQGATLPVGWWNRFPGQPDPLKVHYGRLYESLSRLEQLRYRQARPLVLALRDFWRAHPALDDRSGTSQIADACDEFLAQIRSGT